MYATVQPLHGEDVADGNKSNAELSADEFDEEDAPEQPQAATFAGFLLSDEPAREWTQSSGWTREWTQEMVTRRIPGWSKKVAISGALMGLALLLVRPYLGVKDPCAANVDLDAATELEMMSRKLASVKSKADSEHILARTKEVAGKEAIAKWEANRRDLQQVAVLPADPVFQGRAPNNAFGSDNRDFQQAYCFFNAFQAGDALMGMGVDIHSIAKACPERDGHNSQQLICEVDSAALFEWVGEASTRLSQSASNCAVTANIPAQCAAGITGLVSGMGELAANAALLAGSCPGPSQAEFKTEEASEAARRLFLGTGKGGVAVQCVVDVGQIISNIGNMAYFIDNAANSPSCSLDARFSTMNRETGLPNSNCAVDISGAIAFFLQMVAFVENLVVECVDKLILPLMCGESVTGITASAGLLAHFGASVYSTCTHMDLVTDTVIFADDFLTVIGARTALFLEECSAYLARFRVTCVLVVPGSIVVTLSGKPAAVGQAKEDLQARGMDLPSFTPLGPATAAAVIAAKEAEAKVAASKAHHANYTATAAVKAAKEAQQLAEQAQQTAKEREAARVAAEEASKEAEVKAAADKAQALKTAAEAASKQAEEAAAAAEAVKNSQPRRLEQRQWQDVAALLGRFKAKDIHAASASDSEQLLHFLRPALDGPEPAKFWSSRRQECQGKEP
mmetsp:Transcript_77499/g.136703  ORF Transcript_77499/g.136703 Transcript_77499/m.136703 type:complete len:681 (-) Transcript_77499:172-2214(-)